MFRISTILLISLFSTFCYAQEGYFKLSGGYGFQSFKNQVENYFDTEADNVAAQIRQPAFSLGEGVYFGASGGYYFSSNIGFDIEMQYAFGFKQYFHQSTIVQTVLRDVDIYINGKRFMFTPSLILRAEPALLTPYFKIGPTLGIINQQVKNIITLDDKISYEYWKYTGPMSWGLSASVGIVYAISEKTNLLLELSHIAMTYKPTKFDMNVSQLNGVRNEDDLLYSSKHVVFTEWKDKPYNELPQDPDKPVILNAPTFSYNSLNLNLGVIFKF